MSYGSPAHSAALGNLAGMTVITAGAMGLASGITAAIEAAADARYDRSYTDALQQATGHARDMEEVARAAVMLIGDLEAEVASLRAACTQRSDVIAALKARR